MVNTIAIFNQAGGVAKSTLCHNLGYGLVQQGFKVLLIDFDPQGSLTIFMGLNPWELQSTVYSSMMEGQPIETQSIHGMDILPTNRMLAKAEMELVVANMRERKLKAVLEPVQGKYDFILIDCPPSLGVLSYLALATANQVLIPIQTEFKAYHGTEMLLETVSLVRAEANPELEILGFVPTLYSRIKTQHKRVLKAIQEEYGQTAIVFEPIPSAVAFSDASERRLPLALYECKHEALKPLEGIVTHIAGKVLAHA